MTRLPDEAAPDGVAARAASELHRLTASALAPGLYLLATPIGNLGDITLRALAVLARADIVYCEDTRHSRTLLAHYAIKSKLRPYHEHNAEAERPRIYAELTDGRSIALISDAGTPLVSDPGYKLVREAIGLGHAVHSIPGPSAVLTALTCAGLPTDTFLFAGFLPARSAARRSRLEELKRVPATLIVFEAPSRVAESLADMASVFGDRPAAVARELTKLHEETRRGTLSALATHYASNSIKGEVVILIGPAAATAATDDEICERLSGLLQDMSVKDAAKAVAEDLGVAKSRAYDLALAIKDNKRASE